MTEYPMGERVSTVYDGAREGDFIYPDLEPKMGPVCTARKTVFLCTRELGHEGQHVATGIDHRVFDVWDAHR